LIKTIDYYKIKNILFTASKLRRPCGPFTFVLRGGCPTSHQQTPIGREGLKSPAVRSRADRCPLLSSLEFPGLFPCLLISV